MVRPIREERPIKGVKKPGFGAIMSSNDFFESRRKFLWPGPGGKPWFPHDWFYSYIYFNVKCSVQRKRHLLEHVAWEHYRNCGPTSIGCWPIYTVPVQSFARFARFKENYVDEFRTYQQLAFQEPLKSKLRVLTSKCKNPFLLDEYLAYIIVFEWFDPEPIDTLTGARYDLRDLFFLADSGCLEAFSNSLKNFHWYRPMKNSVYRLPLGPRPPPKVYEWTIPESTRMHRKNSCKQAAHYTPHKVYTKKERFELFGVTE